MFSQSSVDPLCAACLIPIGAMPLDIYVKAVERRGEFLFCPDCRTHKCDCCGWFKPTEDMRKVYGDGGQYLGNACETCYDFILPEWPTSEDFPHFQTMQKPNTNYIAFKHFGGQVKAEVR